MSILGGVTRPISDVAQKAAKVGKLKSVKVKVKFDPKAGDGVDNKNKSKSVKGDAT